MSLDPTKLLDAIISARDQKFRSFENRLSSYGALNAFVDNTAALLPKSVVESARLAPGRLTKIPVLDRQDVTILDKRSCTITGNSSSSKFVNLAWITKGFEISYIPAYNAGNYISAEEDYAHQLISGLIKVFADLDTAAVNTLELNKATSLAASSLADNAGGQYSTTAEDIYWNMSAIMQLNDLEGPFLNISNTESIATWLKYWKSFGGANNQDKMQAFNQAVGGLDFDNFNTNRMTLGENKEVHYFAPQGSIGIFNWNHWEAKNNVDFGNGTKVTIKEDPITGFQWAVTTKTECKDLSTTLGAGYEATYVNSEQWITDFSFVSAYGSGSRTPIIKTVIPKA